MPQRIKLVSATPPLVAATLSACIRTFLAYFFPSLRLAWILCFPRTTLVWIILYKDTRILDHIFCSVFVSPPSTFHGSWRVTMPLCHAIAYLYPAYQTFKAVKGQNPEDHTQWLTFWIVNSCFSVVEVFGDSFFSWLPFFHEAKVMFSFGSSRQSLGAPQSSTPESFFPFCPSMSAISTRLCRTSAKSRGSSLKKLGGRVLED